MKYSREKIAGTLYFIAATQFILCLTISQALYPGYSIAEKYISDLGVGPSAAIFNSSVFLLGLLILAGTLFLWNRPNFRTINILLLLMATGAMGVGIFTKAYPAAHGIVSSAAFFFSGIAAITSFKVLSKPFSFASIIVGLMTLGALAFFSLGMVLSGSLTSDIAYDSVFYLGLGPGGMECMIIFPALIWLAAFGGYLAMQQEIDSKNC